MWLFGSNSFEVGGSYQCGLGGGVAGQTYTAHLKLVSQVKATLYESKPHSSSSTFEDMRRTVEVPYTQGRWSAFLGRDVMTLGAPGGNPQDGNPLGVTAEVACITESYEFFINGSQWQGILGLGYKEISQVQTLIQSVLNSSPVTSNGVEKGCSGKSKVSGSKVVTDTSHPTHPSSRWC